ncbi:hypothetical protein BCV72DRAFT_61090 [Rhizopus microsporus var. microsporus]|uniref:Amino acid transporter transmembrane domain-containing protein n=2 Tax=Rhizopus microsporus TaxID=58291 RepID=A0A2G4T9D1_RHIZD|nr:uncharacterized protein RHIMIDRAFT_233040 [Rhizopus microsporus ATCC 52813]ORE09466.1 hypothetical protein BCV72DRAFT_61090 [Rhizopus microsporus var. microsporus]PHZ17615.1 hypothetical protein RHIMIDRAFT_233040 [Rhizopus microsporus ATCC 52813]
MEPSQIPESTIASIAQQHLVHETDAQGSDEEAAINTSPTSNTDISIPYHLPGAAITHDIYNHVNTLVQQNQQLQRSQSTNELRSKCRPNEGPEPTFEYLDKPGGFRRFHVQQQHWLAQQQQQQEQQEHNPAFHELFRPDSVCSNRQEYTVGLLQPAEQRPTRHFLEYLALTSVINQFAGEDLSDSESEEGEISETTRLLLLHRPKKKKKTVEAKADVRKTIFLLFKAFIGSGILFLPKAFCNGGLVFSIVLMWLMGGISFYCFLLLLECKAQFPGSYGDIGGRLYGPWMRSIVLVSIAVSQMGFMCGGTIFIVQNVIEAVRVISHDTVHLSPRLVFILLMILLTPLVLIRNIAKLSPTALISDALIIAGLVVLLCYDVAEIVTSPAHTGPDIHWLFNPVSYTTFIGTAVYSYEGIGLIIPIRDSMEKPEKFPFVLAFVMFLVACTLCAVGALGYIAFGQQVETVALLNLPPGILSSSVQLGYAMAVLLSNALTLFPTIRIIEHALFGDLTGKHNLFIKWEKNTLRVTVVIVGTLIAWVGASDLDKFVSLIGSVCCCPLSLIFPPLFHLGLPGTTVWKRWIDRLLILFGTSVMVFTFYSTSKQWAARG